MKQVFDVASVEEATLQWAKKGCLVLQAHRFDRDEFWHCVKLLKWADVPENAHVIDMGSGTGAMMKIWTDVRPDIKPCLVNISPVQLSILPKFCDQICCDMQNVPMQDCTFDMAVCCFAIGHVDLGASLSEMYRLLKPNGHIFIYDMVRFDGDNSEIWKLGYEIHSKDQIESAIKEAGFNLDFYMEPSEFGSFGRDIMGDSYERFFYGSKPAIWRAVRV